MSDKESGQAMTHRHEKTLRVFRPTPQPIWRALGIAHFFILAGPFFLGGVATAYFRFAEERQRIPVGSFLDQATPILCMILGVLIAFLGYRRLRHPAVPYTAVSLRRIKIYSWGRVKEIPLSSVKSVIRGHDSEARSPIQINFRDGGCYEDYGMNWADDALQDEYIALVNDLVAQR